MKQADYDGFHAILSDCLSMWSGAPSATATAIWFRTLQNYDLATLTAAFGAHMRDPVNGKFEPKPAHIIEQIERASRNDGRPGPEEAWAISLAARDEADTVVWTNECAQAWAVAAPIMQLSDEVGARMAFKETYSRLVTEARARREAAAWEVSEGFDKNRRRIAVIQAVEAGRIPAGHMAAIEQAAPLLLGVSVGAAGIPDNIRSRIAELRALLVSRDDGPSLADVERERVAALKRDTALKAERYVGGESRRA